MSTGSDHEASGSVGEEVISSVAGPALLLEWDRRLRINIDTHNEAERHYSNWDGVLGTVSVTSLVLLAVTAGAFSLNTGSGRAILLTLTLIGSIASALQSHWSLSATAAQHRIVARQYAALRRAVESISQEGEDETIRRARIMEVRRQWDVMASASPNVSSKIRTQAKTKKRDQRLLRDRI